jgi:uncharacterized protein (DUF924 family)
MSSPIASPADILAFWRTAGEARWFGKDAAFDDAIRRRFLATWEAARDGKLDSWQDSDDGALALVIVLDQFPRNMFRGDARAFATDPTARTVAMRAIDAGRDVRVDSDLRAFFYLPLMHSEVLDDQLACVALYRRLGYAENLKFAEIHADIIRRFGRFPHRNAVLGRATTADEQAFLDSGGFAG